MAKVRFITKGNKNPSQLYIRFYHSKDFDCSASAGLLINPNHWNNKSQRFKSVADKIPNKSDYTRRLFNLKEFIVSEYNDSYGKGELINKLWLDKKVNSFNHRPTHEKDPRIFFIPFIENFIKESKTRVNPNTGKTLDIKTIRKYNTTLSRLKEFEDSKKVKLKHIDIGLDFFQKFISFLSTEGGYGQTTLNKYVSQVKMFCKELKIKGYNYNPEYESKRFSVKRGQNIDTYLNEGEIKRVFELQIEDERQDKIRDLFIIGLWTGLRVGDFSELERLKISGNNILISATDKTSAPAKIPIHHNIKSILNKRNQKLPSFNLAASSIANLFNKEVKEICKQADITQEIIGDLRDKKTNRDVRGIYPKYKLISSHTCRRSFVTNHLGLLPDRAIMTITTHKSVEQLHKYDKKSSEEYIEQVRKHWEEEQNAKLKIV